MRLVQDWVTPDDRFFARRNKGRCRDVTHYSSTDARWIRCRLERGHEGKHQWRDLQARVTGDDVGIELRWGD